MATHNTRGRSRANAANPSLPVVEEPREHVPDLPHTPIPPLAPEFNGAAFFTQFMAAMQHVQAATSPVQLQGRGSPTHNTRGRLRANTANPSLPAVKEPRKHVAHPDLPHTPIPPPASEFNGAAFFTQFMAAMQHVHAATSPVQLQGRGSPTHNTRGRLRANAANPSLPAVEEPREHVAHPDLPHTPIPPPTPEFNGAAFFTQFMAVMQHAQAAASPVQLQGRGSPTLVETLINFMEFGPSRFEGQLNDVEAETWLKSIEKLFRPMNYSDHQKVSIATFLLDGPADDWWVSLEHRWACDHTEWTWENFTRAFNDKYIPRMVRERREEEYYCMKQGNTSVAEFDVVEERLFQYVPHLWNDEVRRSRNFVKALKPEIQRSLLAVDMPTKAIAVERAMIVERGLAELNARQRVEKRPFSGPTMGYGGKSPRFQHSYPSSADFRSPQRDPSQWNVTPRLPPPLIRNPATFAPQSTITCMVRERREEEYYRMNQGNTSIAEFDAVEGDSSSMCPTCGMMRYGGPETL